MNKQVIIIIVTMKDDVSKYRKSSKIGVKLQLQKD